MSDQFEFDLEAEDKQLIVEANEIVWSQTLDWIKKYDSMIIAANMLNSALRLYKTSLSDDEYKATGTASGNGVNGNAFTMKITETLNIDLGCLPSCIIKSGTAIVSPNNYIDRIINYGDSLCDCNFNVILNDNIYPIVIKN